MEFLLDGTRRASRCTATSLWFVLLVAAAGILPSCADREILLKPLPSPQHIVQSGELCQATVSWEYWTLDRPRVTKALASWRSLWPECKVLRVYAADERRSWDRFHRSPPCNVGSGGAVEHLIDACHWTSDGWDAGVVVFTRCQGAVSASWARGRTVERFEDAGFPARLRDQFGTRDLDGIHYWLTDKTTDVYLWGMTLPDNDRARDIAARYARADALGTRVHFGSRPRFPDLAFPCDSPAIAGTPAFEFDPRENRTIRCETFAGRPLQCRESVAAWGVMETGVPPTRIRVPRLPGEM